MRAAALLAAAPLAAALFAAEPERPRALARDSFDDLAAWQPVAAEGIQLDLAPDRGRGGPDDRALRFDFDFAGRGGWAGARRALRATLPAHFELRLSLRGAALPNNLEIKLLDPAGENVWWVNRRDFELPRQWQTLRLKRRHFGFAWGPAGGGEVREIGAIEIVVTAGQGGTGSLWLDDLEIVALPAPAAVGPPRITASPSASGAGPELALDGDRGTVWRSDGSAGAWLNLDFGGTREFGGLVLRWAPGGEPRGYALEGSLERGGEMTVSAVVNETNGGTDWLHLPESEARRLSLGLDGCPPAGCALAELEFLPLAVGDSPNAFFQRLAAEAPPGSFPRGFAGQQSYWTVVGATGAAEEALLSEDGQLELARAGPSLEPFLWLDGRLHTWRDVEISHHLADGELPVPSVTWRAPGVDLEITAFADGPPEASTLWARYRVRSTAPGSRKATLFLTLRPLQVNPATQFLGTPGGVARLDSIAFDGGRVAWNGDRVVRPLATPTGFGATAFDAGEVHEYLRLGQLPAKLEVEDGRRWASAALRYDLELPANGHRDFWLTTPLAARSAAASRSEGQAVGAAAAEQRLQRAIDDWRSRLGRLEIRLPAGQERYARTLRSTLGWILVHRDGTAIQPGSRAYERSWIRDGALTSSALLRAGLAEEARAFIEWYAPFQYPNGAVPCCVDRRGADPVPEHDSHGELIHAIAETWRFTRDRAFLERMFPHVERAVGHLDSLRAERRTPEYGSGAKRIFYGLLPESISHEGYSAKPVHSYWDDFFALRGLKDAVEVAEALGKPAQAAAFARSRDEFAADFHASIRRVIAERQVDFIPGSADLADFDATSTTIALSPGGEQERLPPRELERTFERYWEEFVARRDGTKTWSAYTPYELRNVGAFVRLGWRERAHELLEWFMDHRRPAAWNEWAEVVGRDLREPRFIGDMPHGWVGSDYIRSFLDLFAYERESDGSLVVGAGIPPKWLAGEGSAVRGLRTRYGTLDLAFVQRGEVTHARISGEAELPPGGFVLRLPARSRSATINGRSAALEPDGALVVRALPATIELR